MFIYTEDDNQISLTLKEITLLIVLIDGSANGYYLAKTTRIRQSTVYLALKRLKLGRLIEVVESQPDPSLTPIGQLALEQHITTLEDMVNTAHERGINRQHPANR